MLLPALAVVGHSAMVGVERLVVGGDASMYDSGYWEFRSEARSAVEVRTVDLVSQRVSVAACNRACCKCCRSDYSSSMEIEEEPEADMALHCRWSFVLGRSSGFGG